MPADAIPVFTVGFTKKTAAQFFEKLRVAGIKRVVDAWAKGSTILGLH